MLTLAILVALARQPSAPALTERDFTVPATSEVVATVTASCAPCDWSVDGREAALLEIRVDGTYSQHLALTRGVAPADYRVMLGTLPPGRHHLSIARDAVRSASGAGPAKIGGIEIRTYDERSAEFPWLSRAPILRARPGTVEQFSDFPLGMYAERNVNGESGSRYSLQYTVIFTNEDGGTPTDRLMATWGRTTDIEFIYGLTDASPARAEIQAEGHKWIQFNGPLEAAHPILWVSTQNNMVADHGPDDMIRFAPAPQLVSLAGTSREKVMDDNPWMYAVTSAEMVREHRVDPMATPGSGRIVDPRRYITVEACGQVKDATLAFDIGVRAAGGGLVWLPTDTDPKFRIARGGCFRGGSPLPADIPSARVEGLRVRAYPRAPRAGETTPPQGAVTLERVTKVFMLNQDYVPTPLPVTWTGSLSVTTDGAPVQVPIAIAR
jgi:hypothetical protein